MKSSYEESSRNIYILTSIDISMESQARTVQVRSPTLQTVLMVEQFINDNSGEYTIYDLWKHLPKKMMYQTYKTVLAYLVSINKVAVDSDNVVGYIWNEELGQKYKQNTNLRWD